MTRLSGEMEKQGRLLSSKLFQGHKQVDVVLNRGVLAWKGTEKKKKSSSGISSLSERGKCLLCEVSLLKVKLKSTRAGQNIRVYILF